MTTAAEANAERDQVLAWLTEHRDEVETLVEHGSGLVKVLACFALGAICAGACGVIIDADEVEALNAYRNL